MKGKLKKISCLIMAVIMIFAVSACNPTPTEDDGVIKETKHTLFADGKSDYKIVESAAASANEHISADRLQYYFRMATGIELPIVVDTSITVDYNAKYISIGATNLLAGSGEKIDSSYEDGFKLVTKDSVLLIIGGRDEGIIYGMQEFLKLNLGFGFYAYDEIDFGKETSRKLLAFNYSSKPDFRTRIPYISSVHKASTPEALSQNTNIMRAQNTGMWGTFAHTYFQILPKEIYRTQHPDWYSADGLQLCHTNKEMQKEFIKQLELKIESTPDKEYFSIGQEDGFSNGKPECNCANCTAANEKYGGASGTMMVFANGVRREITKWLDAQGKGRKVYLAVFAYQHTKYAPTKLNDKKEYVPFHPDVVAEPGLMVQFAPLEACFAHGLMDDGCNATYRAALLGWKAITKEFALWTYSTYFTNYFINFNNWDGLKEDYQAFKELGTVILMDQGTASTMGTPFIAMRGYIESQLMWDTTLDVNLLMDDFMRNYYKDAYPYIREYYELTRAHYAEIDKATIASTGKPFCIKVYNIYNPNIDVPKYWSKRYLDSCNKLMLEAFDKIALLPDSEEKTKIYNRVLSEQMTIRAMYLDYHQGSFSKEKLIEMIDSFEADAPKVGLKKHVESYSKSIADKISEWRASVGV